MRKPTWRACLESGPRLDIGDLIHRGLIKPGEATSGWGGIIWNDAFGNRAAAVAVGADMRDAGNAWIEIRELREGGFNQRIVLLTRPRHFGGAQWMFECPDTGRRVLKLYWPPGTHSFASRMRWGAHRVAYRSQFLWRTGRARLAQEKIVARLCAASGLDPNGRQAWMLQRPKRMRSRTYRRLIAKYQRHDATVDERFCADAARFRRRWG